VDSSRAWVEMVDWSCSVSLLDWEAGGERERDRLAV
jgi:hypothetical protein